MALNDRKPALAYAIALLSEKERAELLLAIVRAEVIAACADIDSATDSGLHEDDDVNAAELSDDRSALLEAGVFANALAALPREERASLMKALVQSQALVPTVALGDCDGRPPASEINEAREGLAMLLRKKWTRTRRKRGSGR